MEDGDEATYEEIIEVCSMDLVEVQEYEPKCVSTVIYECLGLL